MKKRLVLVPISILAISLAIGFCWGFFSAKDMYQIADSTFFGWNVFDDRCTIIDVSEPDDYGEIIISTVLVDTQWKYTFRIMPDTIYFEGSISLDKVAVGDTVRVYASYSHVTSEREVICRYVEILPVDRDDEMR